MLLKLMPCLTTKSFIDSELPFQATPITVTSVENLLCALSTEGASKLQVTQPGAQNQRATGFCASCSFNVSGEPSRSEAVKSIPKFAEVGFEATFVDDDAASIVPLEASVPHAANVAVVTAITTR